MISREKFMTTRNFPSPPSTLRAILERGTTAGTPVPCYDMKKLHELVGFEDVWALEKKYAQ
jgi:hypothetical protein